MEPFGHLEAANYSNWKVRSGLTSGSVTASVVEEFSPSSSIAKEQSGLAETGCFGCSGVETCSSHNFLRRSIMSVQWCRHATASFGSATLGDVFVLCPTHP